MEIRLADDCPAALEGLRDHDVVVERLRTPGPLLDTSYDLFRRAFDPAVLDSKETYVDRMSPEARDLRDFLPCYTVAYVDVDGRRIVLGFLSSDVMWTAGEESAAFHAIGNIATSPHAKERGLRGIGSKLLSRAIEEAANEASLDDKELLCVVTEAEPASLGFWKKQGFLWPKGCIYLQPPLEFDEAGAPLHAEVPETLLVKPLAMKPREIASELTRQIVLAIYENWCLRGWRESLSDDAMRRAEDYVLSRVYGEVLRQLPRGTMTLSEDIPTAR